MVYLKKFLAAAALLPSILAHPGHDVTEEVAQRAAFLKYAERRSLAHCAGVLRERGVEARNIARREAAVEKLRMRWAPQIRDIGKVLNTSHLSTEVYTPDTPSDILFAGNNSCILSPEVTEGPYYVSGEIIRENVVEKEPGVPLIYEIQVLNIHTCEPLNNIYVEMWHCNSTGTYGGISGGNAGGVVDNRELNNTMLRGIQPTNKDGVLTFETIFPGHYTGRTPHIHVMAHLNATVLSNATLSGGTVSHVGQLFFDQSLITEVELTVPYSTNTQPLTTNAQDFIMAQEAENGDPVLEYTYLGSKVEDGLFGWIAFGIDPTSNYTVRAAAHYGENGGEANPGGPGGPGGPPPTGGFPPGFPPRSTATTAA